LLDFSLSFSDLLLSEELLFFFCFFFDFSLLSESEF
jgi:hypothetical protein